MRRVVPQRAPLAWRKLVIHTLSVMLVCSAAYAGSPPPPSAAQQAELRQTQREAEALSQRARQATTDVERQQIATEQRALLDRIHALARDVNPRTRYASSEKMDPLVEPYGRAVIAKIETYGTAHFPKIKGAPVYGKAYVSVTLTSAGTIEHVQIEKTSGIAAIDQHAILTVRRAGPFGPFGADLKRDVDRIVFTLPFNYGHQEAQP